jgi:hypothetical protein
MDFNDYQDDESKETSNLGFIPVHSISGVNRLGLPIEKLKIIK